MQPDEFLQVERKDQNDITTPAACSTQPVGEKRDNATSNTMMYAM